MEKELRGKTLEEVYEKATSLFQCSITDLHIEIVQPPKKGFLGFFAKEAVVRVSMNRRKKLYKKPSHEENNTNHEGKKETLLSKLHSLNDEKPVEKKSQVQQIQKEEIFTEFYHSEKQELHKTPVLDTTDTKLLQEIKEDVEKLFSTLCYEIDQIRVEMIDEGKTIYIEFGGKDCALLIGKEGYRYKAFSYILFNWINNKYNKMVRLEIAEFLTNQEKAINSYLEPVIQTIYQEGFFKTKPLDGILIHIALSKLREEFPNKYIAVKTNIKGDKYILVNEYRN